MYTFIRKSLHIIHLLLVALGLEQQYNIKIGKRVICF